MVLNRKWVHRAAAAALALCVFGMGAARAEPAEGAARSAKGRVTCGLSIDLYAPIGGQVMAFDWAVGDRVDEGEQLISIRPAQLLAASDGVVRSLRGRPGDRAADVAAQYGALCYIERTDVVRVAASIAKAHDKPENRAIRMGESLRVYNGKDSD
ncbi:MAG: hypothetical protein GX558_05485, partial [Clostridiales bacterium]|nr:hypothetical protein [Clostridiales bacterium]